MAEGNSRDNPEAERLREELAVLRQRLEDEVAYYRAQMASARSRAEAEHLREHAAEVARRRQLEQELAALRDQLDRSGPRVSSSASDAWRTAEEAMADLERELEDARRALERERERNREMTETLQALQGVDDPRSDADAELEDELAALRQALNLSERARAHAQRRAARLAETLVDLRARLEARSPESSAAGDASFVALPSGAGNPSEVDLSQANAVLLEVERAFRESGLQEGGADALPVGQGSELDDAFLVAEPDRSLDRRKLERLRQLVERDDSAEGRQQENTAPVSDGTDPAPVPRSAVPDDVAPPLPSGRRWRRSGLVGVFLLVLAVIVVLLI